MSARPHLGIYRITVRPRRRLDSNPSETAEKVSESLSDRRIQFERCGTRGDSAFVEVENKKIPIAMRVLREKRFDPSPPECVQRATVRFPVLIQLVLFPRPGRETGDEPSARQAYRSRAVSVRVQLWNGTGLGGGVRCVPCRRLQSGGEPSDLQGRRF